MRDEFAETGDIWSSVGEIEHHRNLLWQQVWEYLIQECQGRASRRCQSEQQDGVEGVAPNRPAMSGPPPGTARAHGSRHTKRFA